MTEDQVREAMVAHGRSLFARGYGCGTSGNLSARVGDGFLMSPTNVSLGRLDATHLSRLDAAGRHVDGPAPTKESWLHLAVYRSRPEDAAVVHLHSTYAVALSCRTDLADRDALPALTPYAVMRLGRVARIPYRRPGDDALTEAVTRLAWSIARCCSRTMARSWPEGTDQAVAAAEELEEAARVFFLLEGRPHQRLSPEQVDELLRVFGRG
jgi:ribulose-5-phosphate 4-epimerase/fuculose-1-phosphate aldolase